MTRLGDRRPDGVPTRLRELQRRPGRITNAVGLPRAATRADGEGEGLWQRFQTLWKAKSAW